MEKISAVIITYNEENNIGRCIDSVREVADEIIVLDSYSKDNTVQIATARGAIVRQQPFAGYIEQKNAALDLAAFPYVLSLDADEALDEKAIASIREAKLHAMAPGYTLNRCTQYCGRFIRHGSWYPDRKLRLFDKRKARWGGINPHDKVEMDPACVCGHLGGDILHYSYHSVSDHTLQNDKFSTLSANAMFGMGRRTNPLKMVIHPAWAFFLCYILRAGFLDGIAGFVIAVHVAHLSFLKHAKLYFLQRGGKF